MPLLSSGLCDIGQKRKTNQDAIYLNSKNNIYLVADGMGGHLGGDIASSMAVEDVSNYILSAKDKSPQEVIIESIHFANEKILEKSKNEPKLNGMGTTIVTMLFRGQHLYIGNVGDSRSYLVNRKKLYQLTRDHSLVQEKLNIGLYTREQAARDPQKNILVRTVGFEDEIDIDVYSYKVSKNDIFLSCSDGLHGAVSDEDIVFLINKFIPDPSKCNQAHIDQCVEALLNLANDNGGHDNISIVLVLAR